MSAHHPRLPDPIFLGFCAKLSTGWPYPVTPATAHIAEVASTGVCLATRPPGWIARWDFNHASCWDDEAAAWAPVPPSERTAYRMYGYRAVPMIFDTSGTPYTLLPHELFEGGPGGDLPPEPALTAYELLGYDIVQYVGYLGYGHSPLVCNHMAEHYPVNAWCLLDDVAVAVTAAMAFGLGGVEPGPYIIFEVWRRAVDQGAPSERDGSSAGEA